MRVYFDTCVVIYEVEGAAPWAASIRALSAREQPEIVVSDLVRMESLVLPLRRADTGLADRFRQFFEGLEVVGSRRPCSTLRPTCGPPAV